LQAHEAFWFVRELFVSVFLEEEGEYAAKNGAKKEAPDLSPLVKE
jgi:hypothetical protein